MTETPKAPTFAIIKLRPSDDICGLLRLLLLAGYRDVSFVNRLQESFMNDHQMADIATQTDNEQISSASGGLNGIKCEPIDPALQLLNSPAIYPPSPMFGGMNPDLAGPFASALSGFPFMKGLNGGDPLGTFGLFPPNFPPNDIHGLPAIFRSALQNAASPALLNFGFPNLSSSCLPDQLLLAASSMANSTASSGTEPTFSTLASIRNTPVSSMALNCQVHDNCHMPPAHESVIQANIDNCIEAVSPALEANTPESDNANPYGSAEATVTVRQRGRILSSDDPLFATCNLCKNRIMCSRVSNLTNHVRRHASLKQFQCCHCEYSHNEMAKVRLHMLHNHKDSESQPINNITQEMKISWDLLMEQCFPDHWKPKRRNGALECPDGSESDPDLGLWNAEMSPAQAVQTQLDHDKENPKAKRIRLSEMADDEKASVHEVPSANHDANEATKVSSTTILPAAAAVPLNLVSENDHFRPGPQSRFVTCQLCSEAVNIKGRARHVRKRHLPEQPYVCSLCGYEQSEHNKVNLHILLKHRNDPTVQILVRNFEKLVEQLTDTCFGRIRGGNLAPTATVEQPVKVETSAQESENFFEVKSGADTDSHIPSSLRSDSLTKLNS